jgi:putative ABC transport system permease protein
MIKHLATSSLRTIRKNASSSAINFLGLTLGFVCIMIIVQYISHELTYDQYHENADRIFRITHNEKAGEIPGIRHVATVGPPLGPALKQSSTQVEDVVRFRYSPDRIMRVNNNQHYESRVFYVDPSVFHVFSFTLLKGDPSTALLLPNQIVITSAMATKYFGDEDPMGQLIVMDNATNFTVTGVLAALPSNTHLPFDFLIPFEAFQVPYGYPVNLSSWGWISFHTYVLLKPGATPASVEQHLLELVKSNWPEERAKKFKLQLQPLTDIYLGEPLHEDVASGNKVYLIVLAMAGCFILLIAGFNFANLYTVVSIARAKEMGIRKMMGAEKHFATRYIIIESVCLAAMAALLAIVLLPTANDYLSSLGFDSRGTTAYFDIFSLMIFAIAVSTGLLAALYPASLVASYNHQQLLKGTFRTSPGGIGVRRGLVLIQFCVTIALIASVMIIQSQMEFIGKKDLGYAKDELLLLRMPGRDMAERYAPLKARLMQNPHVQQVSLGGGRMDGDNGNVPIYVEGNLHESIPMAIDAATFDFFKTIGISMVTGREISEQQPADTLRGVLINESAAKTFGWTPEQALGKRIRVGDIVTDGEVIGVVPDFNFSLLKTAIQPLVMSYPRTRLQDIYVRFQPGTDMNVLISSIQSDWQAVAPEFPLDFTFLSAYLNSLYTAEKFFYLLFRLFAAVAIGISCLGLFALVSQDVLFRVKEIGIRKTLGASVLNILSLIVQPFMLLILLAGVIAAPISWWGMRNWLNEFSYHTSIEWSVVAWALGSTMVIALLTVSYKALRAGMANPVKSLRSE